MTRNSATERFKRQNTAKPVYDGAPNLVDPRIDDIVRELKQSCVTVLVKKAGSDQSGTVYAMRDTGEDRARFRDSALANSQTMVDVWEVYYETADLGRRVCCFCPQFPDLVLSDRPWTWVALIGVESEPPVREWPFVQFRNEDATGFYNTRGIQEILEVDQKEASTYRTTRAIAIDFAGKPFLSGHKAVKM